MADNTTEQQISDTPRDSELTKEKSDDFSLVSSSLEGSQTYAEIPGVSLLDFSLNYSNSQTNKQADINQPPPPADTPSPPDTTEEPPRSPTPSTTTRNHRTLTPHTHTSSYLSKSLKGL